MWISARCRVLICSVGRRNAARLPPPRIWGLTHGGGPREAFQPTDYDFEDANYLGRIFFDLFFWVLIAVIIMNLVLGIIVDTFSQLRSERERNLDEISNYCFICGLPAFSFHEASGGFHNHHRCEHNMWDYVYYRSGRSTAPCMAASFTSVYFGGSTISASPIIPIANSLLLTRSPTSSPFSLPSACIYGRFLP